MIYSERQYTLSKNQLVDLKSRLAGIEEQPSDPQWLRTLERDAIKSQIEDIQADISEYELLKSGAISSSTIHALQELPRTLVRARIASGMSQTDLAVKLDMKPQQIQRYEASEYMGASLGRLIAISQVLGVKTSGAFEQPQQITGSMIEWHDATDIVWSKLPYREMIKRKWFRVLRHENPIEKVREYFLRSAGPQFATAYHRKKIRGESVPNEYALLAWQARVLEHVRELESQLRLQPFILDDRWLPDLVSLTRCTNGAIRARELLAEHGIALVIERHLPGSYLDGAAMLNDSDRPIIGLTLRYDRLDNFWFVLFHEIGHIFLHLLAGVRYDFFDEDSNKCSDIIEQEADQFALNTLISEEAWDRCISRFALSRESVCIDAETLNIAPSIIAGRIRKEQSDYSILSDLVGNGLVRSQFEGQEYDFQ